MAYQAKNLSALGYANGFTLWHYRTEDPLPAVTELDYLSAARRMVRVGDFILVNAAEGQNAAIVVTTVEGDHVGLTVLAAPSDRSWEF